MCACAASGCVVPRGGDPHRGLKPESRKFCGEPSFYAPRFSKLRYDIETKRLLRRWVLSGSCQFERLELSQH
jgi:hypothetical protein